MLLKILKVHDTYYKQILYRVESIYKYWSEESKAILRYNMAKTGSHIKPLRYHVWHPVQSYPSLLLGINRRRGDW